jgi:hypothetical protein
MLEIGIKAPSFTLQDQDGVTHTLEQYRGKKSSFIFTTKNRLFLRRQTQPEPIGEATYYTCRVDGDKMVYDAIYGEVYDLNKKEIHEYFQMVDGERKLIDKEAFDDLYWEYGQTRLAGYNITSKRFAPRIHLPLVENKTSEGLPVADFSSYDAIRETCKEISTCLDKFETSKFFMGEYDDLFAFTSDLAFEYYISFLYSAYRGSGYTGYDEIDLNGDGQDELAVIQIKGKKTVTVCRLLLRDLREINLVTSANEKSLKEKYRADRIHNYCPDLCPARSVYLLFEENGQRIALRLQAGEEFLSYLKRYTQG